jgi:hypothetical protein
MIKPLKSLICNNNNRRWYIIKYYALSEIIKTSTVFYYWPLYESITGKIWFTFITNRHD